LQPSTGKYLLAYYLLKDIAVLSRFDDLLQSIFSPIH